MKITGPNAASGVRTTSSKRRVSKAGFAPDMGENETAGTTVGASSPIASVEALIALQGEESIDPNARRATRRASSLLGILDTIRLGLIDGGIPEPTLKRLLDVLGEKRDDTGDPALEAILEQVEIRAQVELAKLETASSQNMTLT